MHEDNNSDILLLLCQGMCGENTATVQGISRDEQDDYAIQSYTRSQQAAKRGDFNNEIVPITVKSKKSCKYYVHYGDWILHGPSIVTARDCWLLE